MSIPDLPALRRRARLLQRAVRAGDPEAIERMRRYHPGGVSDALSAAQLVVAREHGYPSWPRLKARTELLAAIQQGRLDEVRRLVSRGIDYTSPDPDGRTPAWYARGDRSILEYLFSPRATGDLDAVAGVRDLMRAVYRGDDTTVDRIAAEQPAVVHEARRMWPKAIESAVIAHRPESVVRYARLGFDVHAAVQLIIGPGPNDYTALHWAAQRGDVDTVRLLLSLGADPRARSDWGGTVVDTARETEQAAVLELLQG